MSGRSLLELEEISELNNIERLEEILDQEHVTKRHFPAGIIVPGAGSGSGSYQNMRRHKSNEFLYNLKNDKVIREEPSEDFDEGGSNHESVAVVPPVPDKKLVVTQIQTTAPIEDVPEHRCPNADVTACELCKAISIMAIIHRNFKLRGEADGAQLVNECSTHVRQIRLLIDKMTPHLSEFDFDECVQANGYRTFVSMAKCGVCKCLYIINEINEKSRFCTLNSHPDLFERLLDWSRIFRVLAVVMGCLIDFMEQAKNDSLFTSSKEALDKLLSMSKERVNLVGFHGKLLGFQFCKSVRFPLHFVSTFMAAFSEIYKEKGFFKSSITSSKAFFYYWLNPSERADRIARICGEDPLTFFKEFWLTQERGIVRIVSNCLGEACDANVEISIPPVRLTVTTRSKKKLTILPPGEYLGIKPIMVRLVSHKVRSGAVGSGKQNSTLDSMSKTLVVHCHGGGFVAQSSNSHLVYLKSFSRGVGAPILSIDYSLSPEAPYPRALHEAFYGYLWALENAHILGSTAEKVILAGDSAGGLLLTGVTILCIEFGVRIPDGLLLIYTPQLLEPAISPARLLSLADPLIPYPALAACLGAYLGKTFDPATAQLPGCFVDGPWEPEEYSNNEACTRKFTTMVLEELDGVTVPQDDWHLSPLIAPDHILSKFPPTSIVTTVFDPCMDDCIELAKRLRELKVKTTLDVLNSLPHGFLNFGRISEECFRGIEVCFRRLKDFVYM